MGGRAPTSRIQRQPHPPADFQGFLMGGRALAVTVVTHRGLQPHANNQRGPTPWSFYRRMAAFCFYRIACRHGLLLHTIMLIFM